MNPEEIIEAYENGERNLQPLLDKMGWKSWLGVAELGLVLDSDIEFLTIETKNPIETPSKYRNRLGQLLEHSPYSERDIITPNLKNKNFNPVNIFFGIL